MQSPYTFSFTTEPPDTASPTITTNIPANNATNVPIATNIDVTFSEAMKQAETQGAFSISPTAAGVFSWAGNTMTFNPDADLPYSTTYTVTIGTDAQDVAGNPMAAPYTFSFTTAAPPDIISPTITATSLANNATDVPITTNIDITFSEAMKQAETQGAFSINPSVDGAFSWSGNIMTFNPDADLAYSQLYTITVGTGSQDEAGNPLVAAYTLSFTTGAAPDIISPTVITTSPANNATDVPVTTNIDISFSETMNQAFAQGAFTISPTVAGAFSWSSNVMTFNPTADLAYSQLYTMTVGTGAQDEAGNALQSQYIFSFTTAAPVGAKIQGVTWEVKGVILAGATVTLDGTTSVVSDANGVHELTATTTGNHTVVAVKTGFRSQTRTVNVTNIAGVYTIDFKANYGLVPNAPNLTYVLACVNKWKFPRKAWD